MGQRLVAGIDSSTQACKVMVRDAETGELVRSGVVRHPSGTEIDPEVWWVALREASELAGGLGDVSALAVAGQQHGMVTLDSVGAVVRPALLWNDIRSAPQAESLIDDLGGGSREAGQEAWAAATGSVPVASLTVTKLRWLAENEPEHAARVAGSVLGLILSKPTQLGHCQRGDGNTAGGRSPGLLTGLTGSTPEVVDERLGLRRRADVVPQEGRPDNCPDRVKGDHPVLLPRHCQRADIAQTTGQLTCLTKCDPPHLGVNLGPRRVTDNPTADELARLGVAHHYLARLRGGVNSRDQPLSHEPSSHSVTGVPDSGPLA